MLRRVRQGLLEGYFSPSHQPSASHEEVGQTEQKTRLEGIILSLEVTLSALMDLCEHALAERLSVDQTRRMHIQISRETECENASLNGQHAACNSALINLGLFCCQLGQPGV